MTDKAIIGSNRDLAFHLNTTGLMNTPRFTKRVQALGALLEQTPHLGSLTFEPTSENEAKIVFTLTPIGLNTLVDYLRKTAEENDEPECDACHI